MIDPYSVAAFPLDVVGSNGGNNILGTATGFLYRHENKSYLVTNWHVIAGRDPATGQPSNAQASIPNAIAFHAHYKCVLPDGQNPIISPCQVIDLYDEDGQALWLQHPDGQNIDVAAIELKDELSQSFHIKNLFPYHLNDLPSNGEMLVSVGMDVFILGFPLMKTGNFPIWKRGTIATEPHFAVDDKPSFLIDSATRSGMSGSPVILRTRGSYHTKPNEMTVNGQDNTKVLGIYSGRFGAEDSDKIQLGIVWHFSVLEEIIHNKCSGSFILKDSATNNKPYSFHKKDGKYLTRKLST